MKFFIASLLLSVSAWAVQDGTYNCGSKADFFEASYKIKTLNVEGVELYHLDITRSFYKNPNKPESQDRTYKLSGVANQFVDENGTEVLVLGNLTLQLENGRFNCGK